MALAAGCSPLTVALIGAHHGSDGANVDSQLLRLLKHADSVN
jgi:hypothetical protein